MRRNSLLKCVLVIACIVCLLAGVSAQAASMPSGIYLTQAESNTGNLASATMMLRAKAYLAGYTKWADITESSVKTVAWKSNRLYAPFTYTFENNSISVGEELSWALTVDGIKHTLSQHPEGIVVQCDVGRYQYHGVWITDCVGDTVYCADPKSGYSGKRITLESSSLGEHFGGQDGVLEHIYSYWYVSASDFPPETTETTETPGTTVDQPAAGPKTATVKKLNYKLDSKKKTAVLTRATDKNIKSITIPDTIKVEGTTYKVTEIGANACKNLAKLTKVTIGKNVQKIGKNAFSGCKKLKTINIKTSKLTKKGIGSGCFKGIDAKATFKVPKKMKKDYQNWLVKTGKAPKKAKFR